MTILHIENRDDVVKHKESAAILAADVDAYRAHLEKRKNQRNLSDQVKSLEQRVALLEQTIKTLINIK